MACTFVIVPPDITISDPTESNIIGDHVNITCMSHGYPTPTVSMYCDNFDTISYPNIISEPASFGNELSNVTATLQINITNVDGLQQCYCIVSVFDGIVTSSINDSVLLLASKLKNYKQVLFGYSINVLISSLVSL